MVTKLFWEINVRIMPKVGHFLCRPNTGPYVSSNLNLQIPMQSAHQVDEVVCTGRLYPPEKYFWYSFPLEYETTSGT
jgi:hypothetical protein